MDNRTQHRRVRDAVVAEELLGPGKAEKFQALDQRKRALLERGMAMLQRDAAIAERNAAQDERDSAISALKLRESSMNDENIVSKSPGAEHIHYQQEMHEMISAVAYDPLENLTNDPTNVTDPTTQTANPRKVVVSYSFPEREKFAEMQRSLSLAVEEGGGDDSKYHEDGHIKRTGLL
ncbi:protein BASIC PENTACYSTEINE6-like [Ipomoea triloba]|uniref:protein BASIC PENTACYSTEINE6-like n=1 Tax=Ipomoea triloba TaxID=35885 RepID=UPI00125DB2D9|nr:protein BASIC PENTACYSTEINE6-like [Ipomoea triloba]